MSSSPVRSASPLRVLVTGSSSGIGLDAARRFLRAGASVVITGSDPDKLARAERSLEGGGRVHAVAGDITRSETARRLADTARSQLGGLDVLVNSSGIFAPKPFLETSIEELDRLLDVNVRGTYRVTQALVPLMIESGGGAIINLGTVLVSQGKVGVPVSAAMASKGAVHALTVSWAAELAQHSIRVNTVAPSIIRTPLIPDADAMIDWHPLGRVGEVEDTSEAIYYLATAPFVSGTVLEVDGGFAHGR
jgi:NAD(P)-dependent dehydrogenase (short-subunit alcohol dehydrogenase family)